LKTYTSPPLPVPVAKQVLLTALKNLRASRSFSKRCIYPVRHPRQRIYNPMLRGDDSQYRDAAGTKDASLRF
jgi:hypothetical protein